MVFVVQATKDIPGKKVKGKFRSKALRKTGGPERSPSKRRRRKSL